MVDSGWWVVDAEMRVEEREGQIKQRRAVWWQ